MGTNLGNEADSESDMNASLDNFVREKSAPATLVEEVGTEHLVAVRTDVLHDAEHAIGNLFQRIYHVNRAARESLGAYADRLTASLQDLERLLELLFDYVTPTELELRRLECGRLAESLAAHVRAQTAAEVSCGSPPQAAVLVDPRMIGRALHLTARGFVRRVREDAPIELRIERDADRQRVELVLAAAALPAAAPADVRLALGVAARLVELHGGELVCEVNGEAAYCMVSLPMAAGN